jgi:CHAT domain-containing protein/tetratricopeptide (TPR) repeat protein
MQRHLSKPAVFFKVMGLSLALAIGTTRAEDTKGQAFYREAIEAVENKDWKKASAAFDKWLALKIEEYGAQAKETGAANQQIGNVYEKAGQHVRAIEAFQRAVTLFTVDPGPHSKELGLVLVELADACNALGESGQAIVSLRRALNVFESNPGPESPEIATCLNKLSLLLLYRDAFFEAEPLMLRALEIREKLYGRQPNADLAASLGNLGLLYFRLGAYDEAEEPLNRALQILNSLAASRPEYLLGASNVRRTLASLYSAQAKFSEAQSLLQRVIDDTSKAFGQNSEEVADAMATLAGIQLQGKQFQDAERWFRKALEIESRKLPMGHEKILRIQNSLAICAQYQGKYDKAREILEQTMPLCLEKLGKDHPLTIAVTHNLGMTLVTLGEKNRAREHTQEFLRLLWDDLENVLAYFPENRRLEFMHNMGFSPYDLAATLGDGPLTAEAVLTFKAAVLESVARDRRRALLARDSDNAKLVEAISELRQQFLEAQLAGDIHRTKDLAGMIEEKEKELSSSLREDATYRPLEQISWQDVTSRLPADAVLLEFVFYNKHLGGAGWWRAWCGAVALTRGREPVFRELGPSHDILKSINSYLHAATGNSEGDLDLLNARTESACRDLFDKLIAPFADVLPPDGGQLFVCPDGQLSFVSFATLLDQKNNFLGSRFQISNVDSGRVFLERSETRKMQTRITLLGNPDFDNSVSGPNIANPTERARGLNENELRTEVNRGLFSLGAVHFDPLPGTAEEIEAIETLFRQNGWETQLLQGSEATEAKLRTVVPESSIVHLATHGYFVGEFNVGSQVHISNPMFCGWLALARANATLRAWREGKVPPPANDGILMAAEITTLDLSAADLVVFSACDTAKGEARNGEGVLGLSRGVALAGAKNLLLTTWEIRDKYTAEFMKQFYTAILAGYSPAAALNKVQANELTKLRQQNGTFLAVDQAGPFLIIALKK